MLFMQSKVITFWKIISSILLLPILLRAEKPSSTRRLYLQKLSTKIKNNYLKTKGDSYNSHNLWLNTYFYFVMRIMPSCIL